MMDNPHDIDNPAMGPLMRDIKNKICIDWELIALFKDDNGMELLVANKINNLLPSIGGDQAAVVNTSSSDHEPMHTVYRMCGFLGDVTEGIIEIFEMK
ncbi:unnamed protein product [Rotaria socialis]|uniref:E3 ubiquitin ligase UBR4 C-terminal domain-containing protein n=2 Tax=Rotaria socialis TaxID=392032 RepID=A0A817V6Q7_9BILA|nr:unnamed protein product [Rotaria socialis]CAF3452943.1 unnamed protein product [Rotaria socialis]